MAEKHEALVQATDETLMKAYQQGDEQAFEVLYQRHSARVYHFLKSRLQDTSFADEVFQNSLLKLHQSRSLYDPSFPFVPWLFTICRSAMLDAVRKRKRDVEKTKLDEQLIAEASVTAQSSAALSVPDLSVLSAAQREALQLRYGQDLSFEEIARSLGTSPSNVRQLVSRAVRKLKKLAGRERE